MHILSRLTRGVGYFINNINGTARQKQEDDVLSCAHCGKVIFSRRWNGPTPPWNEDGGWCRNEMKPLCGGPRGCAERALTYGCEPALKKIEAYAREQYRLAQFSKVAGLDPPQPQRSIIIGGK